MRMRDVNSGGDNTETGERVLYTVDQKWVRHTCLQRQCSSLGLAAQLGYHWERANRVLTRTAWACHA